MKLAAITLAVLLSASIFSSLNQTASALGCPSSFRGELVINEIELNPVGNDNLSSDGVFEQIELFNGDFFPIDVKGWYVTSLGGASSETITLGADVEQLIIPSCGYLIVGRDSQWLDNNDEVIILKDKFGNQADSAGPFTDTINDVQSWQRVYVSTENYIWSFKTSNIGVPNGPDIYPLNHMSDTTASGGRALYSAQSIRAEYVSPTSQLVGDRIDQITLRLAKVGAPTGNVFVGVFDSLGNLKKQFGVRGLSTIGTVYTDYVFVLTYLDLYTIQSGDRIGIKYTGGSPTDYVNVMVDTNTADPFDGANSYRQWFTTSWQSITGEDMYMRLTQSRDVYPIYHMDSIDHAGPLIVGSQIPVRVEYVSAASQLIGDPIDVIAIMLGRTGSPSGTAVVGIFDSLANVKKTFGSINVAALPSDLRMSFTFQLPNNQLYTIQAGDRIGIKYTGGSASDYITVGVESDSPDPFDGTNSYKQWFTGSWQSSTTEDMSMRLMQTHPAFLPITHMSDTTASGGRALYSANSIRGEYVGPTSQLAGDKIDQITLRLNRVGTPTGIATVGIFDGTGNLKKQFGTRDVATIGSTYSDYTFSLSSLSSNDSYTLVSGDRVGIKYTGGSSTNYVNVMVDTDIADPFDGNSSYRQWFTTSWQSFTGEDMYMVLKQTH